MITFVSLIRPFEMYIDPVMPEVAHFCLPGLLPLLKQTIGTLNEVISMQLVHLMFVGTNLLRDLLLSVLYCTCQFKKEFDFSQ